MKRIREGLGELALIEQIRTRTPVRNGAVRLGIGDDCAILRVPRGHAMVVTTDLSLEGVHFRRDWHTPESAGHRCLARGLSDIAAMGARPIAAFLSLALPSGSPHAAGGDWIARFIAGLSALAPALESSAQEWAQGLSGGEAQRLGFARAFLAKPAFLFLDEATSAQDEASEARLMAKLKERLPSATVVSVGHRAALGAFHERRYDIERRGRLGTLVERPL